MTTTGITARVTQAIVDDVQMLIKDFLSRSTVSRKEAL